MPTDDDRQRRLKDAGVIPEEEMPREYVAVFDNLTSYELDVILAVKRRLDEAGRVSGVEPGQVGLCL